MTQAEDTTTLTAASKNPEGGSFQIFENSPKTLTVLDVDWVDDGEATASLYLIDKTSPDNSTKQRLDWNLADGLRHQV